MLKAAARLLLLRVLPRRILPIVTVVEAVLFIRSIRNRSRTKVNPPTASRTARPRSTSVGGTTAEPATATAIDPPPRRG
jgi:hypothetical protein